MKIRGMIWLREIVDKLAFKHHVTPDEVEEVLKGKPNFALLKKASAREKTCISP